ncbi:MAG: hypothetical protein WCJ35_23175 [Planctomycetota bacterium]
MARTRKSRSKTNESLVSQESLPYWFDVDIFSHWQRANAQTNSAGTTTNNEAGPLGTKSEDQPKPAC